MKFFFLAHGIISYNCLRDLIAKGYKPHCVVTHTDLDYDRLKGSFYEPITKLCVSNSIPVFHVSKISEIHTELAKCDVGMCLGFMEIIKKEDFDLVLCDIKMPKMDGVEVLEAVKPYDLRRDKIHKKQNIPASSPGLFLFHCLRKQRVVRHEERIKCSIMGQ